jgi:phosphoglucomutase
MKHFRSNPPQQFAGIKVVSILDGKAGIVDIASGVTKPANLPPSDVLQYSLENGSKVTMRPSGTEPKIKFYFSSCKQVDDIKQAAQEVNHCNSKLADELLHTIKTIASID